MTTQKSSTLSSTSPEASTHVRTTILSWGKYRGKQYQEIPNSYLTWLIENIYPHKNVILL